MKFLRYFAALAVVSTVFIAGGMAAASAQGQSMVVALQQQAAQEAALQASVNQNGAALQSIPGADQCTVSPGSSCSIDQGINLTIIPPGSTPPPTTTPPTTPPDDGGVSGGGGSKPGASGGGTKGLVKTGPSATGWAAIVGLVFVQLGMVVLIRGQRWTRDQMRLLA